MATYPDFVCYRYPPRHRGYLLSADDPGIPERRERLLVAKANLGTLPSLMAGSALLISYTLTVAVSISAGVAAITSALPALHPFRVWFGIAFVALLMLGNLRGIRESGSIFAVPTYLFIFSIFVLVFLGVFRSLTGGDVAINAPRERSMPWRASPSSLSCAPSPRVPPP